MSNHGSRFDREFTPDDLAIVNMGYWDPNADEDSEQADSAPVEAVEAEISKRAEADAEPAEHEGAAGNVGTIGVLYRFSGFSLLSFFGHLIQRSGRYLVLSRLSVRLSRL